MKFAKEEKTLLRKLEKDVEHRIWQAVKQDISEGSKKQEADLRLKKEELKTLHTYMIDLMKLIKRSKLVVVKNSDLAVAKGKEAYTDMVEYYFQQIYKFLRAYERIFRHLIRKEGILRRAK